MIVRVHKDAYETLRKMHGPFIASLLVGRLMDVKKLPRKKSFKAILLGKDYTIPRDCFDRVVVAHQTLYKGVPAQLKSPFVPWPCLWYKRLEKENDQY